MLICFAGVVIIALAKPPSTNMEQVGAGLYTVGVVLAYALAWSFASTNIMNRRLKDLHFSVILVWISVMGLVGAVIYLALEYLIQGVPFLKHDWSTYGLMVIAAVFDFAQVTT